MKKVFIYRLLILLVTMALVIGLLAGCGGGNAQKASEDTSKTDTQTAADTGKNDTESKPQEEKVEQTAGGKITDKPVTLTYWAGLNSNVAGTAASYNEIPLYEELEKRTGVHIEFLHPPVGQEGEQFNLMIASNELPDIIEHNWIGYPGGPEKAIEDGIILKLNDIIDKYAPNLKRYYEANEKIDKMVKTDSGAYYCFPFIRGDDFLMVYGGPQYRKDWLDELNLEIPTTIDEMEMVMREFKDKKGLDFALTFTTGNIKNSTYGGFIISSYGVLYGYYVDPDTGQIKYGPIEPGFKEAMTTLAKWYKEGLLDPDFAAQDGKTYDAKITGGRVGVWFALAGSGIGRYTDTARPENPNFEITGGPWPTLNKGDIPLTGQKDHAYSGGASAAITTQCKEVEIAAKWLDYAYSEEGHMLFNFGIEGESYEMVDGYPKYTEYIVNNPEGLPMGYAMGRYMKSNYGGPFIQDRRYMEQYLKYPEQVKAIEIWSQHKGLLTVPPITPTPDESQRLSSIMNEINTYVDEMFLKFVMGQESLDNFDTYVEQIKKMNIEEAIKIQQAALDRYNAR